MFLVSMSPTGWLYALVVALVLLFTPFILIGAIAEPLSEPLRTVVSVIGSFIVAPALVSYLYYKKMGSTGRESAIFWIYCGIYALLFVISLSLSFSKELSFETILAPIVSGAVATAMIIFAFKIKSRFQKNIADAYEAEREDDIKRHAEGILLAEKMKRERSST